MKLVIIVSDISEMFHAGKMTSEGAGFIYVYRRLPDDPIQVFQL